MIQIINADIFTIKSNLLVHQVNCRGVMGSGIAKEVRTRYPEVFKEYIKFCIHTSPEYLIGTPQIVNVSENFAICNLFGQIDYGRDKRYTNYEALVSAFEEINRLFKKQTVTIPYGLGCGLGGGNWSIVSTIIEETLKDCNVLICKKTNL